METGTLSINIAAVLLFLGLAAVAALIMFIVARILFKKPFSYFVFLLSAILGGLAGILILFFGSKLEAVKAETTISSISTLITMVAFLLFILMLTFPLMTMLLLRRKIRIKELEDQIKKLSGGQSVIFNDKEKNQA